MAATPTPLSRSTNFPPHNLNKESLAQVTKVQQIDDVNEVIAKWPRLLTLMQSEATVQSETLLQMFLRCLTHGAVFFAYGDHGLMGACCVEDCGDHANLLSLPRDNGVGMATDCLARVDAWAVAHNMDEVRVTSTNLCGSSFRYFEKSLGFRRHAVTFKRMI